MTSSSTRMHNVTSSAAVRTIDPGVLTVGQTAVLTCSTDFFGGTITSIKWLDPTGQSVESVAMATSLNLAFNPIIDSLHNVTYTCTVTHSSGTEYMERITLAVAG